MPVLFLIAIVVVLVGIFFAATGRGGELAYEAADHAPLDLGPVSAADIALLRPPTAMWGYNMQVTDEALDQIARAMRERDITIAYLQEQLAGYERERDGSYTEPRGAYARQDAETSAAAEAPGTRESPEIADAAGPSGPESPAVRDTLEVFGIAEMFEVRGTPETFSHAPETPSDAPETPGDATETPSDAPETPSDATETPGDATETPSDAPETPSDAPETPSDAPETPSDAPETPSHAPETPSHAPETPNDTSGTSSTHEPPDALESHEARPFPEDTEASQPPGPQRTNLVLKVSGPKAGPHEVTQPAQALQDPEEALDATEPSAVLRHDEDSGEATQPSAARTPDEAPGPQGAFDTHGWWAEQKEAAREEQAHRQASGKQEGGSISAAEEQNW